MPRLAKLSMNIRLLIIEPDETQRRGLVVALENWVREVVSTANPFEALKQMKETRFDLVLSDIDFPTADGLRTIGQIRAFAKDIPIIVFAVRFDDSLKRQLKEIGIRTCIQKPINIDDLKAVVLDAYPQAPSSESEEKGK
jgi:CheY-like chemotaxis protein